jgi:hypothetical protein
VTAVEQAIVEIAGRLARFAPILEGLRDYGRLNLEPPARTVILERTDDYVRRIGFLEAAKAALEQLVSDGHPDMAVQHVNADVFADLSGNASTIEAALEQFDTAPIASGLNLAAGPPVPK